MFDTGMLPHLMPSEEMAKHFEIVALPDDGGAAAREPRPAEVLADPGPRGCFDGTPAFFRSPPAGHAFVVATPTTPAVSSVMPGAELGEGRDSVNGPRSPADQVLTVISEDQAAEAVQWTRSRSVQSRGKVTNHSDGDAKCRPSQTSGHGEVPSCSETRSHWRRRRHLSFCGLRHLCRSPIGILTRQDFPLRTRAIGTADSAIRGGVFDLSLSYMHVGTCIRSARDVCGMHTRACSLSLLPFAAQGH